MEDIIFYSCFTLFLLLVVFKFVLSSHPSYKNLPPSPVALPVIGHLHLLTGTLLHRSLFNISQNHGRIFTLRLGSLLTVVVSSKSAVDECFTKNDVVLANRPTMLTGKYFGYNFTSIASTSYGEHWRNLRRISAVGIFSPARLNEFLTIRKDEVNKLMFELLNISSHDFVKVEMKTLFAELSFNLIMRMVAGKQYYRHDGKDVKEAMEFKEMVKEIFGFSLTANFIDCVPILQMIGKRIEMKMMNLRNKTDAFLQRLIDERRSNGGGGGDCERRNSFLDHLIRLQESEPEYHTDEIIKGLILAMVLAGTDTVAVTLEWAMACLVNHTQVLNKAKLEIDTQLSQNGMLEEQDINKLHYLQHIIEETLRLYPAAPLLLPHRASTDCTIGGYTVPEGTVFLVNAWAIHRDPELWDEPEKFKPERFESEEGKRVMAFGLGRRACPGAVLANRVVGLALGSLIQCFEWKRVGESEVEMVEGPGLTMPKAKPLEVLCKARPILLKNNNLFHNECKNA